MNLYLVVPGQDYGGDEYEKLVCAVSALEACELVATDNHENVERFEPVQFEPWPQGGGNVADDEWANRVGVLRWTDLNLTVWKPVEQE
jgi:hypothetical protein